MFTTEEAEYLKAAAETALKFKEIRGNEVKKGALIKLSRIAKQNIMWRKEEENVTKVRSRYFPAKAGN